MHNDDLVIIIAPFILQTDELKKKDKKKKERQKETEYQKGKSQNFKFHTYPLGETKLKIYIR